jgi:hypothetical protein
LNASWPQVRAALIALHLIAITLMAVPSPQGGMSRAAWKEPTVQGEFAAWAGRLDRVGIHLTTAELEERLWDAAVLYEDVRDTVLAPFMPYYRYCGTWQSWRMFVAPHRYPSRLHIEVREGESWRPIYIARSDQFAWHRRQLDHDRMRAAVFRYAWRHYRRRYSTFGRWVAGQVAQDFPDAEEVQLRFYKYRTPSPVEVRSGTEPKGSFSKPLRFDLADFR